MVSPKQISLAAVMVAVGLGITSNSTESIFSVQLPFPVAVTVYFTLVSRLQEYK